MRILTTGCAGFIGARLAGYLLDQGHEVVGLDCFTSYYDPAVKRSRLAPLMGNARFRLDESDLRTADLDRIVDVDAVCHLAGQPGVRASWGTSFEGYVEHNVLATQRLLEAISRSPGNPRVVFSSTSSLYGDAETYPTPETAEPRPISPYGVTKLAAEHLLEAYRVNFGLDAIALRYFTVYGPGQRPDMAFHRFITSILDGESVHVFGDGEQLRDVTYVDDVVVATTAAIEAPHDGLPINVAGGSQVSVNRVLELLGSITGRQPVVSHEATAKGDVRRTGGDISRARRILGYEPSVGIEEGLRRQVDDLRGLPS